MDRFIHMKTRGFAAVAAALLFLGTNALADPRPPIKGVSAVRIGNYGAPSKVFSARGQVSEVVEELNALRKRPWRRGDTKLSCYATLILLQGEKTVGLFRIRPEYVVERPQEKTEPSYSLIISAADIPRISGLMNEIAPPKNCQ